MSEIESATQKAIDRIKAAHKELEGAYAYFADLWNAYNEGKDFGAVLPKEGETK